MWNVGATGIWSPRWCIWWARRICPPSPPPRSTSSPFSHLPQLRDHFLLFFSILYIQNSVSLTSFRYCSFFTVASVPDMASMYLNSFPSLHAFQPSRELTLYHTKCNGYTHYFLCRNVHQSKDMCGNFGDKDNIFGSNVQENISLNIYQNESLY